MARPFIPQIATGNDLIEGDVVYFTAAGTWSREHGDAETAASAEAAAGLLTRAAAFPNVVVGVYLADCAPGPDGRPVPVHFREAFRTRGPSNHPDHGKQAGA